MTLIREFHQNDAVEVSSLIRRSILIRDNSSYSNQNIEAIVEHYSPKQVGSGLEFKTVLVYEDDGKIVGTGALEGNEVLTVFIDPEYQNRGIGSKLMDTLEVEASTKGHKEVWLVAGLTAVRFYEKRNYRRVFEKIHPKWGKGITMTKTLGIAS